MKHSDPKQPGFDDRDTLLEEYFTSARETAPMPDAAFIKSVMDNIPEVDTMGVNFPISRQKRRESSLPWWRQILSELGGWPTLTGLATAGIVGIWIGLTGDAILGLSLDQFQAVSDFTDPFVGSDLSYIEG